MDCHVSTEALVYTDARAQPAASTASFQPTLPQQAATQGTPPRPQGHHRAQKSTEEIMRIFDQPSRQEATFGAMPSEGGHSFFPPAFTPHDASAFSQGLNGQIPSTWPAFKMPQVRPSLDVLPWADKLIDSSQYQSFLEPTLSHDSIQRKRTVN